MPNDRFQTQKKDPTRERVFSFPDAEVNYDAIFCLELMFIILFSFPVQKGRRFGPQRGT